MNLIKKYYTHIIILKVSKKIVITFNVKGIKNHYFSYSVNRYTFL
jgi:hypothetical protein